MKKVYFLFSIIMLASFLTSSCKKDDEGGTTVVEARDRGEEAVVGTEEIEAFLETHFYNYEEFETPPADFDFLIRFDTIAGDNASKIPLLQQVSFKTVKDRVDEGVFYKLYYLNAIQGGGKTLDFPDIATISYEGRKLDNTLFDSSVVPIQFDLTQIVNGLQDALIAFNGATSFVVNGNGTISFMDYGVGAVFIPSGLGYFNNPPSSSDLPLYEQLIFTFQLYETEIGDQDADEVPSIIEDTNNNGLEEDDDTDSDLIPNYADDDDDNDGRLTKDEVIKNVYTVNSGEPEPILESNEVETSRTVDNKGVITITTITFTDSDGDGVANYLDSDS